MKRIFTILVLLAFIGLSSFAQSWVWERFNTETYHTYANATSIDPSGNVYVTGHFMSNHISFGNITLNKSDTGTTGADFFIVKYDPNGTPLWAKSAAGFSTEFGQNQGQAVITDRIGNVYVTGRFSGPHIIFDQDTLTNSVSYYFDYFIAKYDPNGVLQWVKNSGGTNDDRGLAITIDAIGNVYAAGTFKSPTITLGNYILTNNGNGWQDIFIVKYDLSGNLVRAMHFGGGGDDMGVAMAIDGNYNIYLTGGFSSPVITFGTYTLTLPANSYANYFVVKMDSSGTVQWAKSAGYTSYNYGSSICLDNVNNVYVTGYFRGDSITFNNTTLTNTGTGTDDIFLAKYKTNGVLLWAKSFGGPNDEEGDAVITDGTNTFLTGSFSSARIAFGSTILTNGGSHNIFITELDATGSPIFAKSVMGNAWDQASTAAIDANNDVYIAGSFSSDTCIFDSDTLFATANYQMFLAKLHPPVTTEVSVTNSSNQSVSFYPNPNNGTFTLHKLGIRNYELGIVDVYGRNVYSTQFNDARENEILALPLSSGLYFWQMLNNGEIIGNGKVVIITDK